MAPPLLSSLCRSVMNILRFDCNKKRGIQNRFPEMGEMGLFGRSYVSRTPEYIIYCNWSKIRGEGNLFV